MKWKVTKNPSIVDLFEIVGDVFEDDRGMIFSLLDKDIYRNLPSGLDFKHVKFNSNEKGVIRGFHGDSKTWKLVSVITGKVQQVVIDLRKDSKTYGRTFEINLEQKSNVAILIPPGVANGFQSLEQGTIYCYALSYAGEYADAGDQFTLNPNKNEFFSNWAIKDQIVSKRDKNA
jgi:dTDP-4-dehydrorhamnose 3,5-epimerase